jgi:hypothetical protein
MNQSQFRGLLIVYAVGWLILAAFSGYLGLLLGAEALMSDEALQPQAATARETVLGLLMGLLAFGGTVLAVVAWLGLFVFWKPARILYAIYLGLVYLALPSVGGILHSSEQANVSASLLLQLQSPWIEALESITALLEGAILVIVFSRVGAHLFEKTRLGTN